MSMRQIAREPHVHWFRQSFPSSSFTNGFFPLEKVIYYSPWLVCSQVLVAIWMCVWHHFVLAHCLESLLRRGHGSKGVYQPNNSLPMKWTNKVRSRYLDHENGAYETSRYGSFALFLQMTTGLLCWLARRLAFLALMEARQGGDMTEGSRN